MLQIGGDRAVVRLAIRRLFQELAGGRAGPRVDLFQVEQRFDAVHRHMQRRRMVRGIGRPQEEIDGAKDRATPSFDLSRFGRLDDRRQAGESDGRRRPAFERATRRRNSQRAVGADARGEKVARFASRAGRLGQSPGVVEQGERLGGLGCVKKRRMQQAGVGQRAVGVLQADEPRSPAEREFRFAERPQSRDRRRGEARARDRSAARRSETVAHGRRAEPIEGRFDERRTAADREHAPAVTNASRHRATQAGELNDGGTRKAGHDQTP